ncbi:NUDIX hydrolase [Conexibacter sp. JD483]|uniref:NUDIX hydrolase n=1 Tax=unclassified Conexibacter TaxID=2627773 RepID=UPI002722ECAC|nr:MULTISPECIES: NUDIX hydrolase [unclassified Conexibacter]MDO8186094.1 NUDIX hydrolase [Conexibacter sp. CPCC 205706]MDO8199584.1 NUDIX hydrolase [Conexibacter sp. CPCC 205762]MDR9371873.1 NUDIX hydrolase [Conexibacter sp. JD483]
MEPHPGLGPGEEVNAGPVTPPRTAASVIVVRGGTAALELLLVQRTPNARFMGGVWVFPGGSVDPEDGPIDHPEDLQYALRVAALREVAEEAGVRLDNDLLTPFSRWITPAHLKTRFDTWFFVAAAPRDAEPRVDGEECVDFKWLTPTEALAAHQAGQLPLVFPTIKHLEQLRAFSSANQLLEYSYELVIEAVEPRIVTVRDELRVLLPGDPGYEQVGRR